MHYFIKRMIFYFRRNIGVLNTSFHGITVQHVQEVELSNITAINNRYHGLYIKTRSQKVQLKNINTQGRIV